MHGERVYRTETGTYGESELAVLVWLNPEQKTRPHARLFATITDSTTPNPMAFPIKMLKNTPEFADSAVSTGDSVAEDLLVSTQTSPVIISLPIARDHLGWTDFYIPTHYVEPPK